jgi:hypothetical protein
VTSCSFGRINHADVRSADYCVGDLPTAPIELRADPEDPRVMGGLMVDLWKTSRHGRRRHDLRFGAVGLVAAALLRGGSS